jgi:phosphoesterase RecJ-like protein
MSATDIAAALRDRTRFILASHARPDGDAVGSQMALGLALRALGKEIRLVSRDPVPGPYRDFPGVSEIEITSRVDGPADAVVMLECSDLTRPGIQGFEPYFVINVDHHLGNAMYGDANWFDGGAAACAEMVADIIDALGVTWTPEIASHLFLGIATDTGSFRHGPISARTFEACRRVALAGVDPAALSRRIFDSFGIGRVKLTGTMLSQMELVHHGRLAILQFDDALLQHCGATIDDTEGLVNLPLGAREVCVVALFKRQADGSTRVSLRSKDAVDVRSVAGLWSGGGHKNAAGCTLTGDFATQKAAVVAALARAIDGSGDSNARRASD